MAQSNHHRPGIPAGDEERPACRTSGSAPQHCRDLSALAGHRVRAIRLPATATREPRIVGARGCVGLARR